MHQKRRKIFLKDKAYEDGSQGETSGSGGGQEEDIGGEKGKIDRGV